MMINKTPLRLALSLFIIAAGSLSALSEERPDVDEFFAPSRFLSVDMSPNGQRLAVTGLRDPMRNTLLIYDIGSDAPPKSMALGQVKSDWVEWATDERLILSLTVDLYRNKKNTRKVSLDPTFGGYRQSFSRLVAVDASGKNPVTLFKDGEMPRTATNDLTGITSFLRNDPDHILVPGPSRTYSLYKVNIKNGRSKKIEEGGPRTLGYHANRDGLVNIRYDWDGWETTRVLIRNSAKGKWQTLTKITSDEIENFNPIAHAADPELMYMMGRPEGEDLEGLYLYNIRTETFTDAIAKHDTVDVHGVLTDSNGGLVGSVFYTDRFEYNFIDESRNDHMSHLRRSLGDEVDISLDSVNANGDYWLLKVDGPRRPGSYYRYQLSTQDLIKVFDVHPELKSETLAATEVVNYTSRDGLALKGYLTRPDGATAQTPLIVMPHGGPVARDYYGYDTIVQFIAAHGYQVFQPNFRGGSGYGQAFKEAGHREWGGAMQDDITDGVQYLINDGKSAAGKICIFGISYGGFAALSGVTKTPDLYECAVSINGVSDLLAMIKSDREKFVVDSDSGLEMVRLIGHPRKDKDMLLARSPSENTDKITAGVMIIDGADDIRVDNEQADIMVDAMQQSGKPVTHIHYPNANHSLIGIPHKAARTEDNKYDELFAIKDAMAKTVAFFDFYLR